MNRDDIIRMAREADEHADLVTAENALLNWYEVRDERFAALVASVEREACAKLCEDDCGNGALNLAEAIRARGQA